MFNNITVPERLLSPAVFIRNATTEDVARFLSTNSGVSADAVNHWSVLVEGFEASSDALGVHSEQALFVVSSYPGTLGMLEVRLLSATEMELQFFASPIAHKESAAVEAGRTIYEFIHRIARCTDLRLFVLRVVDDASSVVYKHAGCRERRDGAWELCLTARKPASNK